MLPLVKDVDLVLAEESPNAVEGVGDFNINPIDRSEYGEGTDSCQMNENNSHTEVMEEVDFLET